MLKRILVLVCTAMLALGLCSCKKGAPQSAPGQPQKVETSSDLVGLWCMQLPWPQAEAKEFGEEMGLENFETTAKIMTYVELKQGGTATYLGDFELLLRAAKGSYYTIFFEAFTQLKNTLDQNEFNEIVEQSYGYQSYQLFLQNQMPENYNDSPTHIKVFELAHNEMLEYQDKSIEEQAAIGALWSEILEGAGSAYRFENGEWISLTNIDTTWSFADGVLKLGSLEYAVEGDTLNLTLTSKENQSTHTWIKAGYEENV